MKRALSLPVLLFAVILIIFPVNAKATAGWVTIEGWMEEFSLHMPEGYFAYRNKDSGEIHLSSYKDKVSINVSISTLLFSPRDYLTGLEDKYDQLDCKYDYYTPGQLTAKVFSCDGISRFYKTIYAAYGARFYKMTIAADSPNNVNISLFLMSLRFRRMPLFPKYNEPPDKTEKIISEKGLKNDPLVEQYLKTKDNDSIQVTTPKSIKTYLFSGDSPVYSRDLIIIRRKADKWFHDMSKKPVSGSAKLRIRFLASGQIDKVEVVASSSWEYTQKAIDSLKDWRFVPAQIDGKDVDCSRIMEFNTSMI